MRCVPTEHIVRAFASGASSFAMPTGRNQALISSQPVPFVSAQTFFSLRNRLERLFFCGYTNNELIL
jgi:hypothetical protein